MAMPDKSNITTEHELLFWLVCQNNPKVVELTAEDMVVSGVAVTTGTHNTKAEVAFKGGAKEPISFNRVNVSELGTMDPIETNTEGWTDENLKGTAASRASVWFAGKKVITPAFGDATIEVVGGGELNAAHEVKVTLPIKADCLHLIGSMVVTLTRPEDKWITEPELEGFTVAQLTIE